MKFRKYEKVERWDHQDEIEGINIGTIHIQEKIDGANGSVWHDIDNSRTNWICVGKRSAMIGRANMNVELDPINTQNTHHWEIKDDFRGFPKHIFSNKAYFQFFRDNPAIRLYGEFLVKHTVIYAPEYMKRFWIFDVYNNEDNCFLPYDYYVPILQQYNLDFIPEIMVLENPHMETLLDMVRVNAETPESSFGAETIEGLVYKNYGFQNRYGRNVYMKAVTKEFREVHHAIMGSNRFDPPEVYLANKYLQVARMEKIYNKMKDDNPVLQMRDIPQFIERCLHDMIVEDSWQMLYKDKKMKKKKIDLYALRKVVGAKSKNWFITKLQKEVEKR